MRNFNYSHPCQVVLQIDYKIDSYYKPGLYELTKNFLYQKQNANLCTLDEQIHNIMFYNKIAKYKS